MINLLMYPVFNSDGLLSTLEPCDPVPFNASKMKDFTPDIFLQIARLSGLTDEVSSF
jgi:hypothetical protein